MTQRPIIGVTLDSEQPGGYSKYPWYAIRQNYADAIVAAGGLPIALPHDASLAAAYLDRIDALVVTGGAFDVDPALYGDAGRHATVTLKQGRTAAELALTSGALVRDMPVLGICGGEQLQTVRQYRPYLERHALDTVMVDVCWQGFSIQLGGVNAMAAVGGITILIGAALAFVQDDIKKVLAYSTISQLGYMVMGLGVGAWTGAVFHLFTHAFFKALLFLGAGSIAHSGSHHSFDMKKDMGGLRKYMPVTFVTFVIGSLALAGIFPLAGFWSKD